ncbi:hypothetical protein llap_15952 [Limosa lapponica baueri]|uniref:Cadherin domain-containing protein n=1 Tax=Limosa lapponica baueri TaxID=1758121 RepID=A0A2I0TJ02_LIMLA|nr:hypothetical protein llap_15952 [Limosa lapponica baueri]
MGCYSSPAMSGDQTGERREDAGPSTLVATVRAKDPDGDGLLYLITGGNEEGNFELDSQKGIIKLRRNPPPSLKGPQYTLNITAIDDNASGGPTPLSSFAEVIVGVNDINNNKPVFREDCTGDWKGWQQSSRILVPRTVET